MQLYYVTDIYHHEAVMTPDESAHAVRVMRLGINDIVYVTDGRGTLFEATIMNASPEACRVHMNNMQSHPCDTPDLVIAIAPTKNKDRFEWFIEKAVELGCTAIQPIWCDHSERKQARTDRWDKIALAAMKQSLHLYLPEIKEPIDFKEFVDQNTRKGYIAWVGEEPSPMFYDIYDVNTPSVIAIGPEGDFSDEEIEHALQKGWLPSGLGSYRLRTETAGVTAMAQAMLKNEQKPA